MSEKEGEKPDSALLAAHEQAIAIPSLSVNRFYAFITRTGVRITFGERGYTDAEYMRVSVTLNLEDTEALHGLLGRVLGDYAKAQAETTEAEGAQENAST